MAGNLVCNFIRRKIPSQLTTYYWQDPGNVLVSTHPEIDKSVDCPSTHPRQAPCIRLNTLCVPTKSLKKSSCITSLSNEDEA